MMENNAAIQPETDSFNSLPHGSKNYSGTKITNGENLCVKIENIDFPLPKLPQPKINGIQNHYETNISDVAASLKVDQVQIPQAELDGAQKQTCEGDIDNVSSFDLPPVPHAKFEFDDSPTHDNKINDEAPCVKIENGEDRDLYLGDGSADKMVSGIPGNNEPGCPERGNNDGEVNILDIKVENNEDENQDVSESNEVDQQADVGEVTSVFDYIPPLTVPNSSMNIFQCHVCGKAFGCLSSLGRHVKIHDVEGNFKCSTCLREFSNQSDLERHMTNHIEDKSFICGLCNKSFSRNNYLLKHMIIHQRLFKCDFCDKSFASSCHLQTHVRTHTGEKPYKCEVCSKSFAIRSQLLNHIVIHSGEKPYQCPVCEKYFSDRSSLGRHLKTHSGQKAYQCPHCEKRYGDSSNLKRHMKNHGSQERKYTCEICQKSFMENYQLTRHLKMHERLKNKSCKKT